MTPSRSLSKTELQIREASTSKEKKFDNMKQKLKLDLKNLNNCQPRASNDDPTLLVYTHNMRQMSEIESLQGQEES